MQDEYDNDLEVLRTVVKIMGQKEFSKLCGIPASNICNYLKKGKDLKISTIQKLMAPFGVKIASIRLDLAA